jgi:uncharacterized protein YndB with AHSA1/START domain
MNRKMCCVVVMMAGLTAIDIQPAAAQERVLRAEFTVAAEPKAVWDMWTTEDGLKSFLAPGARVDPRVDGDFEIFFSPAPPSERGAESLRIVAFEPQSRFAFTWNAPPHHKAVRAQRTIVEIRFAPSGHGQTRVTFLHWGWGMGEDWDKAYDFFDQAWNRSVLPIFLHRIAHGPVNWSQLPQLKPLSGTMKHDLTATGVISRR